MPLLVFELDSQQFALPVQRAQRILRAVAITPLPGAPALVLGVVDIAGTVLPAIDTRARFGCPPRPMRLTDQFILADTGRRRVALLVDAVTGVLEARSGDVADAATFVPGDGLVDGALMLESGLILIHDLGRLLSLDEETELDDALLAADSPVAGGR